MRTRWLHSFSAVSSGVAGKDQGLEGRIGVDIDELRRVFQALAEAQLRRFTGHFGDQEVRGDGRVIHAGQDTACLLYTSELPTICSV